MLAIPGARHEEVALGVGNLRCLALSGYDLREQVQDLASGGLPNTHVIGGALEQRAPAFILEQVQPCRRIVVEGDYEILAVIDKEVSPFQISLLIGARG